MKIRSHISLLISHFLIGSGEDCPVEDVVGLLNGHPTVPNGSVTLRQLWLMLKISLSWATRSILWGSQSALGLISESGRNSENICSPIHPVTNDPGSGEYYITSEVTAVTPRHADFNTYKKLKSRLVRQVVKNNVFVYQSVSKIHGTRHHPNKSPNILFIYENHRQLLHS